MLYPNLPRGRAEHTVRTINYTRQSITVRPTIKHLLKFAFTSRSSIDLRLLHHLTCWSIIHEVRYRRQLDFATITAYLKCSLISFQNRSNQALFQRSLTVLVRYRWDQVFQSVRVVPQYSGYLSKTTVLNLKILKPMSRSLTGLAPSMAFLKKNSAAARTQVKNYPVSLTATPGISFDLFTQLLRCVSSL